MTSIETPVEQQLADGADATALKNDMKRIKAALAALPPKHQRTEEERTACKRLKKEFREASQQRTDAKEIMSRIIERQDTLASLPVTTPTASSSKHVSSRTVAESDKAEFYTNAANSEGTNSDTNSDMEREEGALDRLEDSHMHAFEMLFAEYTVWWWEAFESLRRILLTGFLVLCGPGSVSQILIGLAITVLGLNVFMAYRPMVSGFDNKLSERSQWATLIVFIFALAMRVDVTPDESDIFDVVLIAMSFSVPLSLVAFGLEMYRSQSAGSI